MSHHRPVRLGAVAYLNARPLVFGLEPTARFEVRFDTPSRCADLLHEGSIDVGLIPSIEYLRGPVRSGQTEAADGGAPYRIVPDLAIASRGPVASVSLYTTRPLKDVRSIALDTSSRTSVALVRVLCARVFRIAPVFEPSGPDLTAMLTRCDAALIIGDNALLLDHGRSAANVRERAVDKVDLGEAWTTATGLPFVYAFWAGRPDALAADDVRALQWARNAAILQPDVVAREYFRDAPELQSVGTEYLRDNIKYYLGAEEQAGLELFHRYAVEAGAAPAIRPLRFY